MTRQLVHGPRQLEVRHSTDHSRLLKKELQPIMAAKFDRIIPCHGDVIDTGGKVEWDKVWGKYA